MCVVASSGLLLGDLRRKQKEMKWKDAGDVDDGKPPSWIHLSFIPQCPSILTMPSFAVHRTNTDPNCAGWRYTTVPAQPSSYRDETVVEQGSLHSGHSAKMLLYGTG